MITNVDKFRQPNGLLWKYCDDDMAPFKKAIFYLETSTDVLGPESSIDMCTQVRYISSTSVKRQHRLARILCTRFQSLIHKTKLHDFSRKAKPLIWREATWKPLGVRLINSLTHYGYE